MKRLLFLLIVIFFSCSKIETESLVINDSKEDIGFWLKGDTTDSILVETP